MSPLRVLRRLAGFYLVTLGPITWQHLAARADFGELLDSIVSTLTFTLAYGVGLVIERRVVASRANDSHAFLRGVTAGLVAIALVVAVWLPMSHDVRDSFGAWSLVLNLTICAAAAFAVEWGWLRISRTIVTIAAAALVSFALLNAVAYRQAWTMLHFELVGKRTIGPERLRGLAKLKVIATGVTIPKPVNARTPDALGMPYRVERFTTQDGFALEAWWVPLEGARGTVLMFHGYAGEKSTMLEDALAFREQGWSCLLVDQRGSGGSSGWYTSVGHDESADVAAAVRHARDRLGAPRPLVLYGQSMGAVSVVRALSIGEAQADGAILEGVFDRMLNTVRNRFAAMRLPAFPSAELLCFYGGKQLGFDAFAHNPEAYAHSVTTPTLLLHGAHDPRATVEEGRRVYESLAGAKWFVVFAASGHEALERSEPVLWRGSVATFLDEVVATTRPSPPDAHRPSRGEPLRGS